MITPNYSPQTGIMKKIFLLLLICFSAVLGCVRYPKVAYNIPADYPADKKKELVALLDKGQKIYKENCAECHGIFSKGKDNIPNFTTTQLDNYSSRFLRRDPQNHSVLANMSQSQLNEVLTFLRFKKTTVKDTIKTKPAPPKA